MTTAPVDPVGRPLLGVAGAWGSAEMELARRFDALHQLIYVNGGIRPTNAAVEELAKLILIRLWSLRHPGAVLDSGTRADALFQPGAGTGRLGPDLGLAFATALRAPDLHARTPAGRTEPVWPLDEPFRLANPTVLAAATALVAEAVTAQRLAVSDPLGAAFDALLAGRYDHAGGLGTYLTPSGVARMMAEVAVDLLLDGGWPGPTTLQSGPDTVAGGSEAAHLPGFGDPCCGTGRFLVAMLEVLRERSVDEGGGEGGAAVRRLLAGGAFGTDQSLAAVAKARINMLLYQIEHPLVWTVEDCVTDLDVRALTGRVPLILTNPPFGDGKYDNPAGLRATGQVLPSLAGKKRIDPALACLAASVRLLAPGGVLGAVLPDGILASAPFAELVSGRTGPRVAAVISLPTPTFALSGTVARTSAVFLTAAAGPASTAAPNSTPIVLSRVDHVGYVRQAGRAAADPGGNQLPQLPGLVRAARAEADAATLTITSSHPLVAVAAPGSLACLDPARLDPQAMQARRSLAEGGGIELRELLELRRAARARAAQAPYISVLHVDDLGTVDWLQAGSYQPTTPGLIAESGDLIVSLLNPSKLRAAVIPDGFGPVQVSAEFGVFAATCDPFAVLGMLYSQRVRAQLRPLGTGTSSSRRRIDADDVLDLLVPKMAPAAVAALGRAVRAASATISEGRRRLRAQFDQVDAQP